MNTTAFATTAFATTAKATTAKAIKIQRWWKKRTSTTDLRQIYKILKSDLTQSDLQELSNNFNAINARCKGDGAGL